MIYNLGNNNYYNVVFWFIPKIIIANLYKPIHNVIIIQVLSDPLNLEKIQKYEYLNENEKQLFRWNKKHFS